MNLKFVDVINQIKKNQRLNYNEIKDYLKPYILNRNINALYITPNQFLFRGRKFDSTFSKLDAIKLSNLTYISNKSMVKKNRANREGNPIFYCSLSPSPIYWELRNLQCGDEIILTSWRPNRNLPLNKIGNLKFMSNLSRYNNNDNILDEMGKLFITNHNTDDTDIIYNITIALAELHLEGEWELTSDSNDMFSQFAGIAYPSIATRLHGTNCAILPRYVQTHIDFVAAQHVRIIQIDNREEKKEIQIIDFADAMEDGNLKWWGENQLNYHNSVNSSSSYHIVEKPGVNKHGFAKYDSDNIENIYHRSIIENGLERDIIE